MKKYSRHLVTLAEDARSNYSISLPLGCTALDLVVWFASTTSCLLP